jgi:hypothetical protein
VEILESQLSTYGKSMGEDRLREEVQRLMEEKEEYQEVAKETLTKVRCSSFLDVSIPLSVSLNGIGGTLYMYTESA